MYHYLFKNISHVRPIWNFDRICICVFVYMCVCVFVYLYLHVRQLGTLFLMSSYHFLSENIAYVGHICNFDQSSICVFVFLCICICMSDKSKLCIRGPRTVTISKIFWILLNTLKKKIVFAYLCICIYVFAHQTLGNIVFEVLVPLPFQKKHILDLSANLTQTVFVYLCICMSDTGEYCFCGPRTITFLKI